MLKQARGILLVLALLLVLITLPLSKSSAIRSSAYSVLQAPITFSGTIVQTVADLFHFKRNADENRSLKKILSKAESKSFYSEELLRENARLVKLLSLRQTIPPHVRRTVFCRVIGRSSASWNRIFLIDKGTRQGVHPNMLVLSDISVVGKVVETGPSVSKVLLITDPNAKVGALIQRTRDHGVLYGTSAGECRMKYLPVESQIKKGDVVETAGLGGYFPKGLMVGRVERTWKEPGQIYQVAAIRPVTDLDRLEEVAVVE